MVQGRFFREVRGVLKLYSRGKVVVRGDAIIAEDRIKIMPHLNMTESYLINELPDFVQTKTMTNDDVQ